MFIGIDLSREKHEGKKNESEASRLTVFKDKLQSTEEGALPLLPRG